MKIFFEESSICAFRCFYHALYKGGSFESSLEFLFAAFFTSSMLVLEEGFVKKQQDDAKIIACHVP